MKKYENRRLKEFTQLKKQFEKYIPIPTPYPIPDYMHNLSVNPIYNCCKNCNNHASNGGSGICNCALPYVGNPSSITYSFRGVTV